MGVGTFPIQNPIVGGGTAFNDIVAQLMRSLADTRAQRAQVGGGLFSEVLGAETAARRRPVNIVDELLLASEFGSTMPLSQVSPERLSQLGGRTNPALGQLFDTLMTFARGANPPAGSEPGAVLQRLEEFQRAAPDVPTETALGIARRPEDFLRFVGAPASPVQMRHGGSLVADPRRALTTGAGTTGIQAAGPVSLVDRNRQTVAVAGEGARPERLTVDPLPIGLGGSGQARTQTRQPEHTFDAIDRLAAEQAGGFSPETRAGFDRDVRFRLEEFMRRAPGVNPKTALGIAQRPGDFERFVGVESDPRAVAARLLGGGIQSDVRFQDPLVRALALGQAPTSATLSSAEFSALPPDLMQALIGIIGEEQLPGFLFALQQFTPTGASGVRRGAAGGVRV